MNNQHIILGVDPGFGVTGFAVLKKELNKAFLLDYGYLQLPVKKHLSERIGIFYDFFTTKLSQYNITDIALETPFLGKNVQSFLKLGYLRGTLYLLAHKHKLTLSEFSPREIKSTITGHGGAGKDQVASMVLRLFPKISHVQATAKNDVTDALAVSLCGFWSLDKASLTMRDISQSW